MKLKELLRIIIVLEVPEKMAEAEMRNFQKNIFSKFEEPLDTLCDKMQKEVPSLDANWWTENA